MRPDYLPRHKFLNVREMAALGVPLDCICAELALTEAQVEDILADRLQPSHIVVEDNEPFREEILTATRCPGCGSLVYAWPCLACVIAGNAVPERQAKRLSGMKLKDKLQRLRKRQQRQKAA